MIISKIKQSLRKVIDFILRLATNKKTWLIFIGMVLAHKLRNFPVEINTSQFMQILNSSKFIIKELTNLNNRILLFTQLDNTQCICHYPVTNLESFSAILLKKKVEFDFYSGFKALLANPYNQVFALSGLLGIMSTEVLTTEVMKLKKYWNKRNTPKLTDDEVLKDLVANESVKNQIKVLIDQLRNPHKYKEKKIKLNKGCLVYGKPGTGKTLLARCLSKLEGICFINTCASEYVELYVGSGPKKVREYFSLARKNQPAIIFIDELESIGAHRSTDTASYLHNMERYSTLNQLLAEMDGVINDDSIVIMAATNREDLLDAALVRPGRFDTKINFSLPDSNLRFELFKLNLEKCKYNVESITDKDIRELCKKCESATGAIIEGIVNEAATYSISQNKGEIDLNDLNKAFEKGIAEFLKFKKYELINNKY